MDSQAPVAKTGTPGAQLPARAVIPGEREDASTRRLARVVVALAVLVALLRFVRLADWSLWIDESLTWTDWHVGLEGGEIKNPAGYWLIAQAVRWCGGVPDEYALRILPAIVGVATVPLTWLAFRRHAGELRASGAALLLAASSWHVYWSQNARFYTFAQATALLGGWIYLVGLRRGSTARAVIGLCVAAGGAAFHPSVALLLPALVIAPFVMAILGRPLDEPARRVARRCLVAGLLVAAVGAKWAFDSWRTYQLQKGFDPSLSESSSSLAHALKTSGFFVTPLLGVAVCVGILAAWKRRDREVLFVAIVVVAAFAGAFALSLFVRVSAQYVFFLLPWVVLVACGPLARGSAVADAAHDAELSAVSSAVSSAEASAGASASLEPRVVSESDARPGLRGGAAVAYLSLLFVPALVTTFLYLTVRQGERPPWREAYQLVWNQRHEDDLVLGMHATVGEYYLSPRSVDLRHPRQIGLIDYFHARDAQPWARYPRRAWFVVNPEDFLDWKPEDAAAFQRMLREECHLVRAFPLYVESRDLSVWVYLRD